MHGIKRVVIFCALTTLLPTVLLVLPLYLRHNLYARVVYAVTESDILEINDGVSTIFCSEHTLQMNGTFNAFQMANKPDITSYRKHIRLKKGMTLPDDTLEYWGFYLLKGATVGLSVCSRFQGASILVVKGERNLRTCGLLDHNKNKVPATDIYLPEAQRQVKVTFESNAQIINSQEGLHIRNDVLHRNAINDAVNEYTSSTNTENIPITSTNVDDTTTKDSVMTSIEQVSKTDEKMEDIKLDNLFRTAKLYVQKHIDMEDSKKQNKTRKLRHSKKRLHKMEIEKNKKEKEEEMYEEKMRNMLHHEKENIDMKGTKKKRNIRKQDFVDTPYFESRAILIKRLTAQFNLNEENSGGEEEEEESIRIKRSKEAVNSPPLLYRGIKHGGNNAAKNISDLYEESSVSSFENGLLNCYEGQVLLAREFEPSELCTNVDYLMTGKYMQTRHNVTEDGYYYYIFYSDNDFVFNDIYTVFDIYKPTFEYENVTKSCLNSTECSFSLNMLSSDRVIVEVPTRDGIDLDENDVTLLISTCYPRMGMYIIFPISVLFFVLGCAFL